MQTTHSILSIDQILLMREASMSSMSIGLGLTQIRRYNFTATGYFYSGLLSFASGVERLAKLILIYDYRLSNQGAYPSNQFLKSIGHKLVDLIAKIRSINVVLELGVDESVLEDELVKTIIVFLTDFAMQARYYNLDYLSGTVQTGDEPLARWDVEIASTLISRHYKPRKTKQSIPDDLVPVFEEYFYFAHTAEDGAEINSFAGMLQQGKYIDVKQKYSVFYMYKIVYFLTMILHEIEWKGRYFPFLREFYGLYFNDDPKFILGKRSWNPVPPYHF